MSKILNPLTYADLAGRRQLRRYVVAALALLGLSLAILGWAQLQRQQARVEVTTNSPAGPVSAVSGPSESQTFGAGTPATAESDLAAGAGESETRAMAAPASCPPDSEAWTFLDVLPGDNYQRIEPTCVYDGLARTVTWHLAERLGYSKTEAAELLGFTELPWQPAPAITALTNTEGPRELALTIEWPPHPDYRYWVVDAVGEPSAAYSLRGCYRTRTIQGPQADRWNPDYAALCVVAVDYGPGWSVSELGAHRYAHDSSALSGSRAFLLFGYTAGNTWVFIGERQDLHVPIEDEVQIAADREHVTAKYGTESWDAAWLARNFNIEMRPLPENWQQATDPTALDQIEVQMNELASHEE